ncbi:hypothetical protein GCM10010932_11920 [Agromyces flavus]|nr:hypothetical protein GCM10010932_11920 [Agromyces flavus]
MTASTGAGMLALWDTSAFEDVDGYDAWEERVNERLPDAIRAGELVPVNIRFDGAYGVRVVVAPDELTEREQRYAIVTSDHYLLVIAGATACLSGLESVGDPSEAPLSVPLVAGRYAVRTTLVAWDEEPDSKGPDGRPTSTALPDFVVRIEPASGSESFRVAKETFDRPA